MASEPLGAPAKRGGPFDLHTVAELSRKQIQQLIEHELIEVIRASPLVMLRPQLQGHVDFCDRRTLERLVYLARRCCRQLLALEQPRESPPLSSLKKHL